MESIPNISVCKHGHIPGQAGAKKIDEATTSRCLPPKSLVVSRCEEVKVSQLVIDYYRVIIQERHADGQLGGFSKRSHLKFQLVDDVHPVNIKEGNREAAGFSRIPFLAITASERSNILASEACESDINMGWVTKLEWAIFQLGGYALIRRNLIKSSSNHTTLCLPDLAKITFDICTPRFLLLILYLETFITTPR